MGEFKQNSVIYGMLIVPSGFRVKSKEDAKNFISRCLTKGTEIDLYLESDYQIYVKKDENGIVSAGERRGDLDNLFNPYVELANSTNDSYDTSVEDIVWMHKKQFNSLVLEGR
jgi:hypothetical protein